MCWAKPARPLPASRPTVCKREAKVLAAMQARPDGSMDDWVALAYDDVPQRIWPVAKRSLLAHVQRLRSLQGNP
jgi:recombination protein RecT